MQWLAVSTNHFCNAHLVSLVDVLMMFISCVHHVNMINPKLASCRAISHEFDQPDNIVLLTGSHRQAHPLDLHSMQA